MHTMAAKVTTPRPLVFTSENISLVMKINQATTNIDLYLPPYATYTDNFPQTNAIVAGVLPTIFRHRCYNLKHKPFAQEITDTQIGHLFEHILLEYLLQLKIAKEKSTVKLIGETVWDWDKEEPGTFHITLSVGEDDRAIIQASLYKGLSLLTRILVSGPSQQPQIRPNQQLLNQDVDELQRTLLLLQSP